jgi:hypothetical protein
MTLGHLVNNTVKSYNEKLQKVQTQLTEPFATDFPHLYLAWLLYVARKLSVNAQETRTPYCASHRICR